MFTEPRVRRARVRVIDLHVADAARRRSFLRSVAGSGLVLPGLLGLGSAQADAGSALARPREAHVVRQFDTPLLELIRLLREACEVEHALMLQYLYAAFSLKPAYAALAGSGAPGSTDLMGVAVQEMQHLGDVNRLLVALGGAPHLAPLEFPFEPDIYPFEFNLEPLTLKSLAKYVYTEAPVGLFDARGQAADAALAAAVLRSIGPKRRPNHVGSLYAEIIELLPEAGRDTGLPDVQRWLAKLEAIKTEGEVDHFRFFRDVLLATHPAFGERSDAWQLAPSDPAYPSYELSSNPTAYLGHEHQIESPSVRAIAWLGNLHYWSALLLLEQYFRFGDQLARGLALQQMLGPMMSIGRHLPKLGVGLPFDPAAFGAAPGLSAGHGRRLVVSLLKEAEALSQRVAASLPDDYHRESVAQATLALQQGAEPAAR